MRARQGGGGAGYGGSGGSGTSGGGGRVYGSLEEPSVLGSGGGTGYGYNYETSGGAGGGSVKLTVGGSLTVNGRIEANGLNGVHSNFTGNSSGGGSGGSIWLTAGILTGSGAISANGGKGGKIAGGGSGGRIAMYFDTYDFSGTFSMAGGSGAQYGGAGTLFEKSSSQTFGELTVDNSGNSGATTPLPSEFLRLDRFRSLNGAEVEIGADTSLVLVSDAFLISGGGAATVYGRVSHAGDPDGRFSSVQVTRNGALTLETGSDVKCDTLTIVTGGRFYLNGSGEAIAEEVVIGDGGMLVLNTSATFSHLRVFSGGMLRHEKIQTDFDLTVTDDLTIDVGGAVDVSGMGYESSSGPGSGSDTDALSGGAGGAGHGGLGGAGSSAGGGIGYGSLMMADALGSGGGDATYYIPVRGGAIRLTVAGKLTVNGRIEANGLTGGNSKWTGNSGGGGSGGSIWLTVGTLAGSGVISADGGNGGGNAGGGAGGRIAMYFDTYDFTGPVTFAGGAGNQKGEHGTIYTIPDENILQLNRQTIAYTDSPFSVQHWEFTGVAGQQIRLQNVNMSDPGIVFDLEGPSSWTGFTGLTGQSNLLTLGESGAYVLTARATGGVNKRFYTFRLQETVSFRQACMT